MRYEEDAYDGHVHGYNDVNYYDDDVNNNDDDDDDDYDYGDDDAFSERIFSYESQVKWDFLRLAPNWLWHPSWHPLAALEKRLEKGRPLGETYKVATATVVVVVVVVVARSMVLLSWKRDPMQAEEVEVVVEGEEEGFRNGPIQISVSIP
ncbi:hypothetical protein HZH66_014942 [Vespula vulgaris]|uniref:Uncharacterized protein n=1 Tax=Vespula vulgaris TaxID=7454 RepID=A0A834J1I7_VESVU|nr:hypothetical protein HZH66_014942 [Vespula vulgaris]